MSMADKFEKIAEDAKVSEAELKRLITEREAGIKERLNRMEENSSLEDFERLVDKGAKTAKKKHPKESDVQGIVHKHRGVKDD